VRHWTKFAVGLLALASLSVEAATPLYLPNIGMNATGTSTGGKKGLDVNIVGGSSAGAQYNEDDPHTSGDAGQLVLGVRSDAGGTLSSANGDYTPLSIDATGNLRTSFGGSLPAGTNNIGDVDVLTLPSLPAGTNNIGDVDVLTLPALPTGANTIGSISNISGTISLPTGAATAAKQPALGTAGSASSDVLTIQGIASMTALKVDGSAVTQPVSAASLPLPSGASTAAKQPALGTAGTAASDVITVQGIASMTALKVDGSAVTQPVSAASLPLPSGAATSALQTTGNTSLGSIDTSTSGLNAKFGSLGQKAMAGSAPVVLASDQSAISVKLQDGSGSSVTKGQTTASGSLPVVLASDQSAVQTKAALNTTGSGSAAAATVSTVITLTAPASAVGFILMNLDTSTANLRWAVGRTATATLGQQLQPGRDTGFVPVGANVSLVSESGTQNYDIQWVSQ
jgi:hypothetical protein